MKKFAKAACLLTVAAMVLTCFSACGKSGKDDKTLLLGGIGPLTGDHANYGKSVQNGAELAVKEINEAGGVNGFTFKLEFQDSQGVADSAVNAYGKLMDMGMDVSLGTVLSGEMASVAQAGVDDGILMLTPSASSKSCIESNMNAFRICFNDPQQGTASADFIAENELAKKVAIFYAGDNDYSVGLYETFVAECAVKGIEITTTQSFTDAAKTDFSAQINAIASSGAEMVFIPIYAAEAATFLTQANGKLNIPFFGCDGLDGLLTKISDPALAEGVMLLTPFAADDPDAKSFVDAYKAAYNATPDQFAADGYDAVYAVKAAVEKAGITPDNKDDTFSDNLVSAMTQITVKGVTGTMTWKADGETNKAAKAMVIKDGVAVLYTK
ncbi:MAG: amino acid ABC transporter substrate-binding protein [Clostridiales bacterium]|nr:MAG: amino acid ABC transporter substrate-binding protein [Clostridiales bacterium]